jgi:hypothetical protein
VYYRWIINKLIPSEDREKAVKMAKIMKYLKDNPELLDKVFSNVKNVADNLREVAAFLDAPEGMFRKSFILLRK